MKSAKFIYFLIITFLIACGPKPQINTSTTKDDTQPTGVSENQNNQVIIASSSEEEKGQPLVATILNRAVGGAEGAFIGNKMDQLADQLEKKFPKADVSRIGEGILMTLDKKSDFHFKDGRTDLSDQQNDQLKKLSRIFSIYKQTKIHLVNHTDALGSAEKNDQVARKRVENIAIQMKEQQIEADRLVLNWHGHAQSSGTDVTDQRLEIGIIAGKQMLRSAKQNVSER